MQPPLKAILLLVIGPLLAEKLFYFSDEVALRTSVARGSLKMTVSKPEGGFLALGVGASMDLADFFLIQAGDKDLALSNCFSKAHQTPFCESKGPWKLTQSWRSPGSSGWQATVERDLSDSRGVPIYLTVNRLIYNYGPNSTMPEGHGFPGNRFGVATWDFFFNSHAQWAGRAWVGWAAAWLAVGSIWAI